MRSLPEAMTYTAPAGAPNHWTEHLRVAALSVGTYCVPAGGVDDQGPHGEDEVYVVGGGRAVLEVGQERIAVAAGSVVHVEAGADHRFVEVTEDLTVLVLFAPPYSGQG